MRARTHAHTHTHTHTHIYVKFFDLKCIILSYYVAYVDPTHLGSPLVALGGPW